jgi:D-sedoheptulose 7-phosphate isomerase
MPESLGSAPNIAAGILRGNIERSIEVHSRLIGACLPAVAAAADALIVAYRGGHKALFFGNGGSAADAQHLAAEFVGRYLRQRDPLPALALNANTSAVTAIANDYGPSLGRSRRRGRGHQHFGELAQRD